MNVTEEDVKEYKSQNTGKRTSKHYPMVVTDLTNDYLIPSPVNLHWAYTRVTLSVAVTEGEDSWCYVVGECKSLS